MLHQPLADELLGKLALRLRLSSKRSSIAVGVEVTRAVGRVDLVDQAGSRRRCLPNSYFVSTEDQAPLRRRFSVPRCEQVPARSLRAFRNPLCDTSPLRDDLLFGDVLVVRADLGLGGRGDDRVRSKRWCSLHAVGQGHAADRPGPRLDNRATSCRSDSARTIISTGNDFAPVADGHHRVGRGDLPVRTDVGRRVEELRRDLVQDLPLVAGCLWEAPRRRPRCGRSPPSPGSGRRYCTRRGPCRRRGLSGRRNGKSVLRIAFAMIVCFLSLNARGCCPARIIPVRRPCTGRRTPRRCA